MVSLLEKELIGAALNSPDASGEALGVLPEYFSNPTYAAVWSAIQDSPSGYSLATIMSDLQHIDGARDLIAEAYTDCPAGFGTTRITAEKLIADYKRRQSQVMIGYMWNEIEAGKPVEKALSKYVPHMEALSKIGGSKSRFQPVSASDITTPITQWLIKGIMPMHGVGFIAGASGAGKSFLTLHAALSMAAGRQGVFGRKCAHAGVAYVAAEDFEGCKSRVKAWRLRNPSDEEPDFSLIDGPVNLLDPACVEDLIKAINLLPNIKLVVIDTLSRCLPGADENSAASMTQAIDALYLIARLTGAFVCAVAHHGKSGTMGGIRGWSGQNAASDMTVTVERSEDDPDLRLMNLTKIKNGIDGANFAFRLDRVGLGIFDEDGDELDSCVCQFEKLPERATKASGRPLAPHLEIVMKAIRHIMDHGQFEPPTPNLPHKGWSRAVSFQDVKERAVRTGFSGQGVAGHDRLSKALESLVAANKIVYDTEKDTMWLI